MAEHWLPSIDRTAAEWRLQERGVRLVDQSDSAAIVPKTSDDLPEPETR